MCTNKIHTLIQHSFFTQLNHAAEPNCEISFDPEGNCYVTALYDIQPGSALTVSYGDPVSTQNCFLFFYFLNAII
jgi:SET domain-containing protein